MTLNTGWAYREQVGPAAAGRSVLTHLTGTRPHSSAATWADRLARGEVELDGARASADDRLRAGQQLVWHRPPWDEPDVPLTFELVHEDEALVAVSKPAGLPTMPAGGFLRHTLLEIVRVRYPEARPMHRLGRHTSGLVLFARTASAAGALARQWRSREVEKRYRALGSGVPSWEARAIDTPIGPVPHARLGTVYAASAAGRPAYSALHVLERRHGSTVFTVHIVTGRPHQVRIHLAWAGHPLVGDPLYASGGEPRPLDAGLPGDGGYLLHAERLAFVHPVTGRRVDLHARPPDALHVEAGTRAGDP